MLDEYYTNTTHKKPGRRLLSGFFLKMRVPLAIRAPAIAEAHTDPLPRQRTAVSGARARTARPA